MSKPVNDKIKQAIDKVKNIISAEIQKILDEDPNKKNLSRKVVLQLLEEASGYEECTVTLRFKRPPGRKYAELLSASVEGEYPTTRNQCNSGLRFTVNPNFWKDE